MHSAAHQRPYIRAGAWVWGAGALGLAVMAWTSWGGIAATDAVGSHTRTSVNGLLSGVFVAGTVIAAMAGSRRHARSRAGWPVVIGALVAAQGLLVALPAIATLPRVATELSALLIISAVGLGCVLNALVRLHHARQVVDDAFAVGLGMGCVAAGHLVLPVAQNTPVGLPMQSLLAVLAVTQVAAVGVAVSQRALPRTTAYLLVVTVLVVLGGFGVIVGAAQATAWDTIASLALAAVGAAWIVKAWSCIENVIEGTAVRQQEELDLALLAEARGQRERLHELRSTVAGLVNGSEMLARADVSTEARLQLWESVRRELSRMQRLLSDESQPPARIDLDDALSLILDLQRLKGRQVELHSSGDTVRARYDSLAEVVNILMDNAATHGGSDTSMVEVVRRDEDTVDITVTDFGRGIPERERERIFAWGERGADSRGEGIGLHLAQRLMAEDGGSLRLAEGKGAGSSFVISLPSPRRSTENHLSEDGHVSWRCSS